MGNKYKCPCCGYYTFDKKPTNTFDFCPICFWEDDGLQLSNLAYAGGANDVSLIQARENFETFGASEFRLRGFVREPREEELNGIDWDTPDDR